jgi:GNAT superfamily N-acetyltransferase
LISANFIELAYAHVGALVEHQERCLEIAKACYPDGWQHIAEGFDHALALEADGKVVDYATIETDNHYISDIAVHPDHQKLAISMKLLNELGAYLKDHGNIWEADCREKTSYILMKFWARQGKIEILNSPKEEATDTMGSDTMYHVKFRLLDTPEQAGGAPNGN